MVTHSDNALSGKTYEAVVHYSCKNMRDGGCAITRYCVLTFSDTTVTVHYYAKASCEPKEREADYSYDGRDDAVTYTWKYVGTSVMIIGFHTYGTLLFEHNTLTSSQGTFEDKPITFIEIKVK